MLQDTCFNATYFDNRVLPEATHVFTIKIINTPAEPTLCFIVN